MPWTINEILAATGGRIAREAKQNLFGEVVTDSSKVKKGSVFVALKGERLDGHRFVPEALKRGATCVIVHRSVPGSTKLTTGGSTKLTTGAPASPSATIVRVGDTLRALGDLAHYRRQKFAPKVIAITGSNGKTTTKEMAAAIFDEAVLNGHTLRGKVLKTEGNFNNLVGLPLTLLRLRPSHKVAIVEIGTNRPGEVQRLAEIARPDMGIITAVVGGPSRRIEQSGGSGSGKRRVVSQSASWRHHRGESR